MSSNSRSRARGLSLILALLALFVAVPVAHAAPSYGGPPVANGGTYLALGDSLAFGYQRYKVQACASTGCTSPDTQFNTGYVNVFATSFSGAYPGVTTVNLGCPGESSTTFLNSTNSTTGCQGLFPYPFAIHVNHPGKTQMAAAVQVLRDKGKKVNPVTLDIGANDVNGLVGSCTTPPNQLPDLTCVQNGWAATTSTVVGNLDTILNTLRAEGGKTKEIIVVGLYNPLYVPIYLNLGPAAAAGTDALAAQFNAAEAQVAAKYHAKFVDPLPVINNANFPVAPPTPPEVASVCYYTLMCAPAPGGDIHASDAGYQAIGNLVKVASGY